MTTGLPAREAAAQSVDRVMRTGAYSNILCRETKVEPPSDHPFFERLVYTTLRHLPYIDEVLQQSSNRKLTTLDPVVLSVLRVGVAEAVILDRSDHAAVNEAVETAKALRRGHAAGFVNGVLRGTLRAGQRPTGGVSEAYPSTLVDLVRRDLGTANGDKFLLGSNEAASTGVRTRPSATSDYVEDAREYAGKVETGDIDIIDPASAAVAEALDVNEAETILDAAAAPGGKTRILADAAGSSGSVFAMDLHGRRLRSARNRPGTPPTITWVRGDAQRPPFRNAAFDRVLLDAPCTGLGTMRRRPEIRHRLVDDAPARYGDLQQSMLEAAILLVKPGGRLVYSVCTVTSAETINVVADRGFRAPADIDGSPHGDGLLLGPHLTGTDGMFIAILDVT